MGWSILSGFPNLQRQKLMADSGVQPLFFWSASLFSGRGILYLLKQSSDNINFVILIVYNFVAERPLNLWQASLNLCM